MTASDIVLGGFIALISSLLTLVISHNLQIERKNKEFIQNQKEISLREIYSPLIFIIEKNRDIFAKLMAIKMSFDKLELDEIDESELEVVRKLLLFLFTEKNFSKDLSELFFDKLSLIENRDFYLDVFLYTSYIGNINEYMLITITSHLDKIKSIIDSIYPAIKMMSDATSKINMYSLAQTSKREMIYVPYYTEENRNKLDRILDNVNMIIFNTPVLDWDTVLEPNS